LVFGKFGFKEAGEPEHPGKNPRSKATTNNELNQAALVRGRRQLYVRALATASTVLPIYCHIYKTFVSQTLIFPPSLMGKKVLPF